MTQDVSIPFSSRHILVVDDNEPFLIILKSILEQMGCRVTTAINGKLAQRVIDLENLDAVISDIQMPEMTGIQLTHYIKQTKPIPVILMTGFAGFAETNEAAGLGADGFIEKPFKKEELVAILKKCLKIAECS